MLSHWNRIEIDLELDEVIPETPEFPETDAAHAESNGAAKRKKFKYVPIIVRDRSKRKEKKAGENQVLVRQQSPNLFASEDEHDGEVSHMENGTKTSASDEFVKEIATQIIESVEQMVIDEASTAVCEAIDHEKTHDETVVDEPQLNVSKTPEKMCDTSFDFLSEHINVDEIIKCLVSPSQYDELKHDMMADQAVNVDTETLSTDDLILIATDSQDRVGKLVAEAKKAS